MYDLREEALLILGRRIAALNLRPGGDLVEYYHKEGGGKSYFLKYFSESKQGVVIVIDSYSKVVIDVDSKLIVDITVEYLDTYNKQEIEDEN